MPSSAIETVRAQFKTALETIAGGTYRNTVKEVRESLLTIPGECPAITILFNGKVKFEPKDSACTAWDIYVPFTLVCDVWANTPTGTVSELIKAKDSLLHDITRVLISLYIAEINDASLRWNVVVADGIQSTDVFPIKDNKNKGTFDVYGTIHIRALTTSI
jgi:hypothetical protein